MEIKIVWTKQAEIGLSKTLYYLEKEWSTKEILQLEHNIVAFINRVKHFPEICPKTSLHKGLYKGMVDKNNYIVYKVLRRKKQIVIVNFKDSRQKYSY